MKTAEENENNKVSIITYGMGVYWSENQYTKGLKNIEIIDIRTLSPNDYDSIFNSVKKCGKCIVVTEEPKNNSFAKLCQDLFKKIVLSILMHQLK